MKQIVSTFLDVLSRHTQRLSRWMLDLFLPSCCVVCGRAEVWLCEECAKQIPLLSPPICERCGQPVKTPPLCPSCRVHKLSVVPIRSAFLFEGDLRAAIHVLKYRRATEIAQPLALRMAEAWRHYQFQSHLLLPVPLHPNREVQRGYNQSALLAEALGKRVGIPVSLQALLRVRDTQSQTKLHRDQRRNNVLAAFACTEEADFSGKVVTLVDDVATTGATLDACATALLGHGATAVNAFTLARA